MKTTDVAAALFVRAKKQAERTGRMMKELLEEGLRRVVDEESTSHSYSLPNRSVGSARSKNPLEASSWQNLRDEIYGGR